MNNLLKITENKIKERNCKITYEIDEDQAHIFQVISKYSVICIVIIYITESENIIIQNNRELEIPVFSINWIKTTNKYKGQGFATMLLIYSICYLKYKYPDIHYAKLDDASDNNNCIYNNLYNKLGFVFQETPTIDPNDSEKLCLKSPEKQLLINNKFIKFALQALHL